MPDVYPAWLDAPILCCLRAAAGMEEELAALRAEEREIMAAQPPTPARAPGADTMRLPRAGARRKATRSVPHRVQPATGGNVKRRVGEHASNETGQRRGAWRRRRDEGSRREPEMDVQPMPGAKQRRQHSLQNVLQTKDGR